MKRLFCAVKIPPVEEITETLEVFQRELGTEAIKWVAPQNLHITLKFFGEPPNRQVQPIVEALHRAAAAVPPFGFSVEGCGTFGNPQMPRVIWLGIKDASGLSELYHEVNHQLEPLGFQPDKKLFTPHLTIGRIKKNIKDIHALNALETEFSEKPFYQVRVNEFYLIESFLQPVGPVYKVLNTFKPGEGHRA